jgi:hypothetical protein
LLASLLSSLSRGGGEPAGPAAQRLFEAAAEADSRAAADRAAPAPARRRRRRSDGAGESRMMTTMQP